jgi:hypothetical protein
MRATQVALRRCSALRPGKCRSRVCAGTVRSPSVPRTCCKRQAWSRSDSSPRRRSRAEMTVATARNNSMRRRRRSTSPVRNCKTPASMRAKPVSSCTHLRMWWLPGKAATWIAPRNKTHHPSANARHAGVLVCHHHPMVIRTAANCPRGIGTNEPARRRSVPVAPSMGGPREPGRDAAELAAQRGLRIVDRVVSQPCRCWG